jgi:predicted membrane-bound spermidine synthase
MHEFKTTTIIIDSNDPHFFTNICAVGDIWSRTYILLAYIFILVFGVLVAKRITGNYTNIVVLFVCFHLLYNIAGPFLVLYSEGLHSLFSKPYELVNYLVAVDFSVIGLWVGITIALVFIPCISKRINESKSFENVGRIYNLSIIFSCCATFTEGINIIRVGGIDLLFAGKESLVLN